MPPCIAHNSTLVLVRPGSWVSLTFTEFHVADGYDFLFIHEDDSVAGRLIGQYSRDTLHGASVYARSGACSPVPSL